ncbi:hypothetical protein D3C86_1127080 [compost metagenome]
MADSSSSMATPEAVLHSLSTAASPPRVASRRAWGVSPAASSASTWGQRVVQSLLSAEPSCRASRAIRMQAPWLPISRDTRMASSGLRLRTEMPRLCSGRGKVPTPLVLMNSLSAAPLGTTLVSPQTMRASLLVNSEAMDSTMRARSA